jgi:hypothetical protein
VLNIHVIFDTLRVLGVLSDFDFSAHQSGLPEKGRDLGGHTGPCNEMEQ